MVIHFAPVSQTRTPINDPVDFEVSALRELGWALHVLSRPSHHGMFLKWALQTRHRLAPDMLDSIEQMTPFFLGWLQTILQGSQCGMRLPRFVDEWEAYMGLGSDRLETLHKNIQHQWTQHFDLRMARNSEWESAFFLTNSEWWTQWHEKVEWLRDQLGWLIKRFWEQEFEDLWHEIVQDLHNDAANRVASRKTENPSSWWQAISPRLRMERDTGSMQILVPWTMEFTVTPTASVTCSPSVFCWPHLWVNGWQNQMNVTYQSQAVRCWAAPISAPARLERMLEALSEPTRLLIVRHLFGSIGTTGSIAHALRLSASTVSRHLTLLHSVGLVERVAMGHYVLYQANRSAVQSMGEDLQNLKRSPIPAFLQWE